MNNISYHDPTNEFNENCFRFYIALDCATFNVGVASVSGVLHHSE